MKLTSAPKLTASMSESPLYQAMGMGYTDNVFLVGHDSSLPLNEPFPVSSMQDAVDALEANIDSPLLLALMEAYYSGARDIWLVAAAPLEEYEPDPESRDASYYQNYQSALIEAFDTLKYWENAQITVPLEAPFNSTVDFLGPLVNYCAEAFALSGEVHLGLLGTRGIITDEDVPAFLGDGRLGLNASGVSVLGEAGKFVSVFVGDGTYQLKELPIHHTTSVVAGLAGEMSQLPLDRGLTYHKMRNVINTPGPDLSRESINQLAEARLNPVGRNLRGRRRNVPFEVISFTDNTLAWDGSDYWSTVATRLVAAVSAEVRSLGVRRLGTIGYDLFRKDVEEYLLNLGAQNVIRGYELFIDRDPTDRGRVLVEIVLEPYFGVRDLRVGVVVGPGQ